MLTFLVCCAGLFSLNNKSGVLSLAKSLDRETADRHELNLSASDGGEPSRQSSTVLVINVTDFNDNTPVLQEQMLHVSISEVSAGIVHYARECI